MGQNLFDKMNKLITIGKYFFAKQKKYQFNNVDASLWLFGLVAGFLAYFSFSFFKWFIQFCIQFFTDIIQGLHRHSDFVQIWVHYFFFLKANFSLLPSFGTAHS